MNKKILVFDTETTNLPRKKEADMRKQPYIVQYAHAIIDTDGKHFDVEETRNVLIQPPVLIPKAATDVHGITNERLNGKLCIGAIIDEILTKMANADIIVAHNASFDLNMMFIEAKRIGRQSEVLPLMDKVVDTMKSSKDEVQAKNKKGHLKNPNLQEAYKHFYGTNFDGAHNALQDVIATARVFEALCRKKLVSLKLLPNE